MASGGSRSGWIACSRSNGLLRRSAGFFFSSAAGSTSGLPPRSSVRVSSRPTFSRVAQRDASPSVTSVPPARTQSFSRRSRRRRDVE